MRFLRGLGIGILCFFIWVVVSVLAAISFIGEYGVDREIDLALISPILSIPLVVSFFGIFVGPLYYWVIEPIRERGTTPRRTYYSTPQQQYYHPPRQVSGDEIAAFCAKCGQKNPLKQKYCANCGDSLVLSEG